MNTQKKKDQFTTFIQSISLKWIYKVSLMILWVEAAYYSRELCRAHPSAPPWKG